MRIFPGRANLTTLLFLLLALEISGCPKKERFQEFGCSDVQITVDFTKPKGVDHKAVYLCETNKVIWVPGPNVKSFNLEFVDDLPFGSTKKFDSGHSTTPPLGHFSELTVFKYNLLIFDTSNNQYHFDPHVVGGGGY